VHKFGFQEFAMAAQRSAKPSVTYINRGVLQKKDPVTEKEKEKNSLENLLQIY
jgi:hypothetical protein